MQSGHDRDAQTNGYNHDSEQKFGDANKERNIYAQSYDMSGRFASNAVPAGYMPEEYFHRQPEMQFRDPELPMGVTDDTRHLPDYNYVQTSHAQSQPAQDLFAVPNARGTFDVTGQACPPGGSPGVTTTVWEDEGTLCFQVDARQTIVARREDNDMINGTKLLNVAQMSRGKRDGILKNEANRTVIKVGSMHLKGVWIPFDRALDLANKNHITDLLYPLFVKGIKKFLYHPKNYARTTAVLAAANSRHAQQIQPPNSMIDVIPEERIALDRSLSMPTPLDRSLSILTPPSSASTNSDYWTDVSAHGPISEIHARTHSLPGTPATTPPAPAYFAHGNGQQPIYPTSYHEARSSMSGNHYGQHPDMQRSYNHSRNASMVSYTEEDMTKENITSRLQPKDNFAALQPRIPINPSTNMTAVANSNRYQPPSMFGRALPNAENLAAARVTMDARNTPNISHQRTHSRTLSRNSNKTFNTPNLTTQMGRRASLTPSNSPASVQVRNASRVGGREQITHPSDASLWVQQQQHVTYSTPQQTSRGHLRQNSGQLPQIYEETPSCRMAYQLHGQGRLTEPFPRLVENKDLYHSSTGSPLRSQHNTDVSASPLNGKKKRERVVSDSDQFYKSNYPYEERQESLTPPPISKEESQESPKRRRSERNGMHSRSASVY